VRASQFEEYRTLIKRSLCSAYIRHVEWARGGRLSATTSVAEAALERVMVADER
jgi:hypothetical protein